MILDVLFKRSLENPNQALYDDGGPYGYGVRSDSGLDITYGNALKYSPWWRGVNLLSRDVAKLPLSVFKRVGEGKEKDVRHPAYALLRRKANDELTSFTFIQTLTANAIACGNGYAFIVRDNRSTAPATPLELRWLDPLQTYAVRENGALLYITMQNMTWRRILPTNVLHIRGLGFDGLSGYPVYRVAADSLGLGIGAQKYGSRFFKNDAKPSCVIEIPGVMTLEAQKTLKEQWNSMHAGLDNAHKLGVLTMGAKLNAFSINARDSQLLQTREFEIREVANWLGVQPHKLGDTTRTAYASLEQENHSYLVEALDTWLCTWESECNDKLLTEREKETESHFFEFNRNALVRASFAERMEGYNTALQGGWMNRDEVRSKENMNPLPEGEGTKFYQPLNMQVVGGDVEPPKVTGGTLPELQELVKAIVNGEIPPEAGKALIQAAYPALEEAAIAAMIAVAQNPEQPAGAQPAAAGGGSARTEGGPLGVLDLTLALQKIYLAVGKVISAEEAREILNRGGANLSSELPEGLPSIPVTLEFGKAMGGGDETETPAEASEPDNETDEDDEDALRYAHREIAEDVAERMAKRIGIAVRKAAKKPHDFLRWLDGELPAHTAVVSDALEPISRVYCKDPEEAASAFMGVWRGKLLDLSERCTVETMPTFVDGALMELEGVMKDQLTRFVIGE